MRLEILDWRLEIWERQKILPEIDPLFSNQLIRDGRFEILDWRLEILDWRFEIGDWRLEIGDGRFEIGVLRLEIWDCTAYRVDENRTSGSGLPVMREGIPVFTHSRWNLPADSTSP